MATQTQDNQKLTGNRTPEPENAHRGSDAMALACTPKENRCQSEQGKRRQNVDYHGRP